MDKAAGLGLVFRDQVMIDAAQVAPPVTDSYREIADEGDEIHPLIASEYPQRHQPCCVHRDDQRIMPGGHLYGATDDPPNASLVGHRDIECV
jgi:hypothetical protein